MPDLTAPLTVQDGAIVDIIVGVGSTHLRSLRTQHRPIPQPVILRAILDSGAECTCVDADAVRGLCLPFSASPLANLPGLGSQTIGTEVQGSLTIVHPGGQALHLVVSDCPLLELGLSAARCEALIGRDVLAQCILTLDGPAGTFTLRY